MDTKGLAYAAAMNLVDQYIDACRLHQAGAITTDELTARQRNLRIMGMTIHIAKTKERSHSRDVT